MLTPWKESYDQARQYIKKQRHYFANKSPSSQGYDFSSGHVWMWELDYKESWAPKNWCFWTVVLEKIPESPLDNKEIQPVHPKGNPLGFPRCSLEELMLKLKLQYFGHLMRRAGSFEKTLMLEKTGGKRRGDDRGWDVWMASRVEHDWVTELNWTELNLEKTDQRSFSIHLGVQDYRQRHCNNETTQLSSIALRSTDTKTFIGYQQTESCKRSKEFVFIQLSPLLLSCLRTWAWERWI